MASYNKDDQHTLRTSHHLIGIFSQKIELGKGYELLRKSQFSLCMLLSCHVRVSESTL